MGDPFTIDTFPATKYDAMSVNSPESLRRQFEEKYDQKKIRNIKTSKTRQ